MDLREFGCDARDYIELAQDRDQCKRIHGDSEQACKN